jgi:RNA polymerase sigma factor (sigma-70 family)
MDDHGALVTWAVRYLHIPTALDEDARQGGAVGLLEALNRYDPAKGRFRSYAASFVLQESRAAVGWDRQPTVALMDVADPSVEVWLAEDEDGYDDLERQESIVAAANFINNLPEGDRDLLLWLYEEGASQTEIAQDLGVNKMAVSRRVAKLHAQARVALEPYAVAA